MKSPQSFLLLFCLLFPLYGHAAKSGLSRRGFLFGTAVVAIPKPPVAQPAPSPVVVPPVVDTVVRPPLPPNYLENRFELLLNGHLKQSQHLRRFSDEGLDRYLAEKALHDTAREYERINETVPTYMQRYYENSQTPVPEYETKIRAHTETLIKIEKRIAQEFKLKHEQVAHEVDRLYFQQLDISIGNHESAAGDYMYSTYAANPLNQYYHYQELERSFAPAGIEVRDRYIELLSEVHPQEAYIILFKEIFNRYYKKGFLYFQKDLPVGFPDRDRVPTIESLHHFLTTGSQSSLNAPATDPVHIKQIKKYWKENPVSAPSESASTPRIVTLIDIIKKRLPFGVNFYRAGGDIEMAISQPPKEILNFGPHLPQADVATANPRFELTAPTSQSELATAAQVAARSIAGSAINAAVTAIQEGATEAMTVESPSSCAPLLIEHKPEAPMPMVHVEDGEKVEELK